jgi:hypothetical protein
VENAVRHGIGTYEEGGVVHLSLKERWIAPLALVGHKVCRVACTQGVALSGEEGGVEEL